MTALLSCLSWWGITEAACMLKDSTCAAPLHWEQTKTLEGTGVIGT